MNINNVPSISGKIIESDGSLNPTWRGFFSLLVQELQYYLSNARYKLPPLSTSQITNSEVSNPNNTGSVVHDSDLDVPKISSYAVTSDPEPGVPASQIFKQVSTFESLTTAEIGDIPSGKINGRFIHDSSTNELKVGFNDTFFTVTTT